MEARRATMAGVASAAILAAFAGLLTCACGESSSSMGTTPTNLPSTMTETRVGTLQGHQLAWVNFQMTAAGLVTLKVDPVLLLTLRAGQCPESCGDFITNSDSGSLTLAAPAGVNSVLVGNPFDEPKAFSLSLIHPR